jgi:hypothetical protein
MKFAADLQGISFFDCLYEINKPMDTFTMKNVKKIQFPFLSRGSNSYKNNNYTDFAKYFKNFIVF